MNTITPDDYSVLENAALRLQYDNAALRLSLTQARNLLKMAGALTDDPAFIAQAGDWMGYNFDEEL
jgi:hypothetical protein